MKISTRYLSIFHTEFHTTCAGRAISRHEERKTELKHTVDEAPHEGPFKALSLKESDFESKHHEFDIMIVNFFAPW